MPIYGKNVGVSGSGRSGVRIDGGSAAFENLISVANNEHGLHAAEHADVSLDGATFADNGGHGVYIRASVIERARAAGVAPDLTDDELFRALQTVHQARDVDRPRVLSQGPLLVSFAKVGLDVIGALASIASWYSSLPK